MTTINTMEQDLKTFVEYLSAEKAYNDQVHYERYVQRTNADIARRLLELEQRENLYKQRESEVEQRKSEVERRESEMESAVEGFRQSLLTLLGAKGAVPADLTQQIQQLRDIPRIQLLIELIAKVDSVAAFRAQAGI